MKKTGVFLFAWLFCFVSLGVPVSARKECAICKKLEEAGFPSSYREGLCALSIAHPTWSFEPLFVTEISREAGEEYDFSFVIRKECEEADRSLVASGKEYLPYSCGDGVLYDTGFYRATPEAVAYLMDPRNFLGEEGVFQFLSPESDLPSSKAVEAVLEGTVAEGLSETLLQMGQALSLDPLQLAVRLRQEQGTDGNALYRGNAGSVLWDWFRKGVQREDGKWIATPASGYQKEDLTALDGYYNPFNLSAYGSGGFSVLLSGARFSRERGWDSLEKGLWGGGEKLAEDYGKRYQTTLYLQKWNVDARSRTEKGESRNFWGQYMQNVGGALTEGKRLYEAYCRLGLLEQPLSFLIPVYEGMPQTPVSDPAGGDCEAFAACLGEASPHRWETAAGVGGAAENPAPDATESLGKKANPAPEILPFATWPPMIFLLFLPWILGKISSKEKKIRKKSQKF